MGGRYKNLAKKAYNDQKFDAKRRGIEFLLTYEEWHCWWQGQLGPDWITLRGSRWYQFVMARYGDAGPYRLDNIKCISNSENRLENKRLQKNEKHYASKLTTEKVIAARSEYVFGGRNTGASIATLAKKYGVCQQTMWECLSGKTWKDVA